MENLFQSKFINYSKCVYARDEKEEIHCMPTYRIGMQIFLIKCME